MSDFIDLHCHYIPSVDDGVRSVEDGVALCRGLRAAGYRRVVATPHIRSGMFDNRKAGLSEAFAAFEHEASGLEGMPQLGLSAEHFFDDLFWRLFLDQELLPYPGGAAVLIELPPEQIPPAIERQLFKLSVKGLRPVIAHPERYAQLFRNSNALQPLLDMDVLAQLDLMSLVGRYGRSPRRAAERLLAEGAYFIACSDCHKPDDLPLLEQAIDRLHELVGNAAAAALLSHNPARILEADLDR